MTDYNKERAEADLAKAHTSNNIEAVNYYVGSALTHALLAVVEQLTIANQTAEGKDTE